MVGERTQYVHNIMRFIPPAQTQFILYMSQGPSPLQTHTQYIMSGYRLPLKFQYEKV